MKSQLNWRILVLSVGVMVLCAGAVAQERRSGTAPQILRLTQQPPSEHVRVTASQQTKPAVRQFDFLDDVELVGKNYAMSKPGKTVSYSACKNACLKNQSCKGFTHFSDGRCHLKESIIKQRKAPGDRSALLSILQFRAASNQIDLDRRGGGGEPASPAKQVRPAQNTAQICGGGYHAYPMQEFKGFNLTLAGNLVTLDGCRRLCNSNVRCKGFSWYGRPGSNRPAKCWMKRRITKPVSRPNRLACEKVGS